MVIGGAMPVRQPVMLEQRSRSGRRSRSWSGANWASSTSAAPARVVVDGDGLSKSPRDGLYVPMGTDEVMFESAERRRPRKFYLVSTPAHHALRDGQDHAGHGKPMPMGALATSNERDDLPVRRSGHLPVGAAAAGPHDAEAGQRLEHHALPPARAALRGLFLLRPAGR